MTVCEVCGESIHLDECDVSYGFLHEHGVEFVITCPKCQQSFKWKFERDLVKNVKPIKWKSPKSWKRPRKINDSQPLF